MQYSEWLNKDKYFYKHSSLAKMAHFNEEHMK